MRHSQQTSLSKFQKYRAARKARGMKLIRIWVPDPASPVFRAEAKREAKLLRGKSEEQEALEYIEKVIEDYPE